MWYKPVTGIEIRKYFFHGIVNNQTDILVQGSEPNAAWIIGINANNICLIIMF